MTLSAKDIDKVISFLESTDPDCEILRVFRQFRKEEFAWTSFEGRTETCAPGTPPVLRYIA